MSEINRTPSRSVYISLDVYSPYRLRVQIAHTDQTALIRKLKIWVFAFCTCYCLMMPTSRYGCILDLNLHLRARLAHFNFTSCSPHFIHREFYVYDILNVARGTDILSKKATLLQNCFGSLLKESTLKGKNLGANSFILKIPAQNLKGYCKLQSNSNGSNIFRIIEIHSRHG